MKEDRYQNKRARHEQKVVRQGGVKEEKKEELDLQILVRRDIDVITPL